MVSKVLVTGGSGFIGGYVREELRDRGIDVLSFDHTSPADPDPRFETFLGDIRDEVDVTEAMSHVDGFIHLAGVLGTQETIGNPRPATMTNILGGMNVLEAAAQYDIPGVNIAVGNHWENNPYSISKSTVERFAKMFRKERGVAVSSVRALNAYGPRQSIAEPYGRSKVRKIMPSFIMRALRNDPIEVYGDGNQIMDMIYVADVAWTLVETLLATEQNGGFEKTLEAGTGRQTTVNDIAREVVLHAGQGEITHLPMRPGETPGAVVLADSSTLNLLPYRKVFVGLEEGVSKTVEYYRNLR